MYTIFTVIEFLQRFLMNFFLYFRPEKEFS